MRGGELHRDAVREDKALVQVERRFDAFNSDRVGAASGGVLHAISVICSNS